MEPLSAVPPGAVMLVYILWVMCTDEKASGYQSMIGAIFYLSWYIAGKMASFIPAGVWLPNYDIRLDWIKTFEGRAQLTPSACT